MTPGTIWGFLLISSAFFTLKKLNVYLSINSKHAVVPKSMLLSILYFVILVVLYLKRHHCCRSYCLNNDYKQCFKSMVNIISLS